MQSRYAKNDVQLQPLEGRVLMSATPLGLSYISTPLGKELVVNGTAGNDVISIARTGNAIQIANSTGWSTMWSKSIVEIRVNGGAGNDSITIKSNVTTPTALYGEAGNDTLLGGSGNDSLFGGAGVDSLNGGAGNDVLVTVGDNSRDYLTGGTGTDSFWTDSSSKEVVSDLAASESKAGDLHRIASFTGPVASSAAHSLSSTSEPALTSGAAKYSDFSSDPLFSKYGPRADDAVQGQLGDCFLLSSIGSVAKVDPNFIRQSIVDLGDGTFAVQFASGSTKQYVRVDAQLPTNSYGQLAYAKLGLQNSSWVPLFEKAYAFYKGSANYGSLNGGFMGDVYTAMGLKNNSIFSASSAADLMTQLNADVTSGKAVTFGTKDSIPAGVPMISDHAYVVDKITTDSSGKVTAIRLRNPWGIDGAGNDGANDGYVTLTPAQAMSAFWFACAANA